MPFDLDLTDPTLTPAERERRRALVAEHQRQVARLEKQRKLEADLRADYEAIYGTTTDADWRREKEKVVARYREKELDQRLARRAAAGEDDPDDPDGLYSPDLWGLRRR